MEPNFHLGLIFALPASVLSLLECLFSLLWGITDCCFCDWVPIVVCIHVWSIYKWKALLKIWPPLAVHFKAEALQSSWSPTGQMTGVKRDLARLTDLTSAPFPTSALPSDCTLLWRSFWSGFRGAFIQDTMCTKFSVDGRSEQVCVWKVQGDRTFGIFTTVGKILHTFNWRLDGQINTLKKKPQSKPINFYRLSWNRRWEWNTKISSVNTLQVSL